MKLRQLGIFVLCAIVLQSTNSYGQLRTWKFGFGVSGSVNQMQSDLATNDLSVGGAVGLTLSVAEHWSVRGSLGFTSFTGKNSLDQDIQSNPLHAKLYLSYDFLPEGKWNPFIFAGGGVVYVNPILDYSASLISRNDKPWDAVAAGGIGVDIFPDPLWSITISAEGTYMSKDKLDGYRVGSNDTFAQINVGFRYYFYDALFFLNKEQN